MDALMSSAQSWVPWVGVAGLILCKGWIAGLDVLVAPRGTSPGALAGFFVCFGLAVIVPVAACVLAWALHGGIASLGPVVVLFEPASAAQQWHVLTWLAAPILAYLLARYLFGSADAIAYAVAAAAAIMFSGMLGALAVVALALAAGGIACFATRALGEVAMGLAASVALVLVMAFSVAGGGQAVALLTLSLVGGLVLALIAAGGKRALLPLFLIMPLVPALGLSYLDGKAAGFDLSEALPQPAIGNIGALILMFAVLPAVIAPFAWLPMLLARQSRRLGDPVARLALEPVAIAIELGLGLLLAALAALGLAAGGALYSHLHELGGGESLLRVQTILQQVRPAPFAPAQWWVIAPLLLPLAPAIAHALIFLTQLWLRLVDASGLGPWLDRAIAGNAIFDRLALTLVKRVLQLTPGVVAVLLTLEFVPPIWSPLSERAEPIGNKLLDACIWVARFIEAWPVI